MFQSTIMGTPQPALVQVNTAFVLPPCAIESTTPSFYEYKDIESGDGTRIYVHPALDSDLESMCSGGSNRSKRTRFVNEALSTSDTSAENEIKPPVKAVKNTQSIKPSIASNGSAEEEVTPASALFKAATCAKLCKMSHFSGSDRMLKSVPTYDGEIPTQAETEAETKKQQTLLDKLPIAEDPGFVETYATRDFEPYENPHLCIPYQNLPRSEAWGKEMKGKNVGGLIIDWVWVAKNGYFLQLRPDFALIPLEMLACHAWALGHLKRSFFRGYSLTDSYLYKGFKVEGRKKKTQYLKTWRMADGSIGRRVVDYCSEPGHGETIVEI